MIKIPELTRGGNHTLSESAFNLMLAGLLLWGFALNWYMVTHIAAETVKAINPIAFLIGYFVSAIIGIVLCNASESAIVRFIGYNLIAIPVGLVLTVVIPGHSQAHIIAAIQTTVLLMVVMMALATVFPAFFRGIGRALFWALLITIVVQLFQSLVFKTHLGVIDWIVALIFCGYIGYDWGRISSMERTAGSAVLAASLMYLNLINLFMSVLNIKDRD